MTKINLKSDAFILLSRRWQSGIFILFMMVFTASIIMAQNKVFKVAGKVKDMEPRLFIIQIILAFG